ncbi:thiamine-phosphate pyrophosphorylase [Bombella intestini]|uniref:Thiamine-phosphate pyrophosphorylase n=1 Tax=Bombella intestini TaxID=1539051 RepID=A0A1S8GRS5_9PROT|nr:thiamine phosphate synthase [Bombella intestini]OOL19720.1 thiamine-phosphate pyrophosphorylase [Bombella intestini]
MNILPDELYPIASTAVEVTVAVRSGVRFIQLRNKSEDQAYLRSEIRTALQSCTSFGAMLVVNDHWEIALEEGAPYIHLGQEDLKTADIARIHRAGVKLGVSTHDHMELGKARALQPAYIALGPIWETTLKVMPWRPQGINRVKLWSDLLNPMPLVAIGGITAERAPTCRMAGAAAVSAVSDIFRNGDPVSQIQHWRECLKSGGA